MTLIPVGGAGTGIRGDGDPEHTGFEPSVSTIAGQLYRKIVKAVPILCADGVVLNQRGQYLLVKRKYEPLEGEWWIVGGRVFKGEKLRDAVKRKVKEEVGIEARILMPLGFYEEQYPAGSHGPIHTLSIVFLMITDKDDITLDEQSEDWKWADTLPERLRSIQPFNLLNR